MKAVIIDDEQESRGVMQKILAGYCEGIEIVGTAYDADSAWEIINKTLPDLVFLDIEMPNGSGFDLLNRFEKIFFEVIFVTGFDEYALNAIKFSCLDYILKPVDIDDVVLATKKAKKRLATKKTVENLNNLLVNIEHPNSVNNKIILPTKEGFEFVMVKDIIRLESEEGYTWLYIHGSRPMLSIKYLKEFETMLARYPFYRVHRKHIVNTSHITKYKKIDGGSIIMSDGSEIFVARRKKEAVLKLLFGQNHF